MSTKISTKILAWKFELNCPCCGTKVNFVEHTTDDVNKKFVDSNCRQWIDDFVSYKRMYPEPMNVKILGSKVVGDLEVI